MFKQQDKIIIVDNNPEHLEILSSPFRKINVGCKAFQYDVNFAQPIQNIRVAFFDINLDDLTNPEGNKNQIFATLVYALKLYIDKENGPFALIFWTGNKFLIQDFKTYVTERGGDVPIPFLLSSIDKDEFIDTENSLVEKLKGILEDKTIELLFDFEDQAAAAASKTINQIYSIIPAADTWGNNQSFKDNFEKIFSKIAISTLGFKHAKENPDKAIYEALLPMLNYYFLKSASNSKWKEALTTLSSVRLVKEITPIDGFRESVLNTIFHIDNRDLPFPLDTRGAVLEVDKSEPNFKNNFGIEYVSWFQQLMPIEEQAKKREIRNTARVIAIEIGSACDFSQNKSRINKYILGITTPVISSDIFRKNSTPQFQFKIDGTYFLDAEFQMWLNLNYVFSALPDDLKLGQPLFVLKKELMDQIGNRYANHVSRIGITSF